MYQHDPSVDVLVKDLGLERGKPVQTPVHDVTEQPGFFGRVMPQMQQVATCLLSQDRADMTSMVKLCQRMSNPTQSLATLKSTGT